MARCPFDAEEIGCQEEKAHGWFAALECERIGIEECIGRVGLVGGEAKIEFQQRSGPELRNVQRELDRAERDAGAGLENESVRWRHRCGWHWQRERSAR